MALLNSFYKCLLFFSLFLSSFLQQQKKIGKNLQLETGEIFKFGLMGWIGLNPPAQCVNRVRSGWSLRAANRGVSGSPPGSKIGLGAGLAGRVHLAALYLSIYTANVRRDLQGLCGGFLQYLQGKSCNIYRFSLQFLQSVRIAGKICKYYRIFPADIAENPRRVPVNPCKHL